MAALFCPTCPTSPEVQVGQEKARKSADVPPVPSVPPQNDNSETEIQPGDRCRHCGEAITWRPSSAFERRPAVAFADGASAHLDCYEAAEVERLMAAGRRAVESEDALADPAELTARGVPLP